MEQSQIQDWRRKYVDLNHETSTIHSLIKLHSPIINTSMLEKRGKEYHHLY